MLSHNLGPVCLVLTFFSLSVFIASIHSSSCGRTTSNKPFSAYTIPPEDSMFCEVKEINTDFSRRREKGRTLALIQLFSSCLHDWENSLHISRWILHCQKPPSCWLTETGFYAISIRCWMQKEVTLRSLTPHSSLHYFWHRYYNVVTDLIEDNGNTILKH